MSEASVADVLAGKAQWAVECCDVMDGLRSLPDGCVQCVVTSPPYWGLRDYGTATWESGDKDCDHKMPVSYKSSTLGASTGGRSDETHQRTIAAQAAPYSHTCGKCGARRIDSQIGIEPTPKEYVATMVRVFSEVRRVLRDDGILWLNIGDSYSSGGRNGYDATARRRPENPGDGREQHPSAGISRPDSGLKPKDLVGIPWRVAFALQADGWYLRSAMPWVKRSAMPESTKDRPATSLEYVFLLTKSARYFYDHAAVMRVASGVSGGASFGKQNHDTTGTGAHSRRLNGAADREAMDAARNFRNADLFFESIVPPHGLISDADGLPIGLDVTTEAFPGAHFATFPQRLVTPLLRAGTSEKGCCPECGAPWRRITESHRHKNGVPISGRYGELDMHRAVPTGERHTEQTITNTIGWEPSCDCGSDGILPCLVLDPFAGACTTLMVAQQLGLRSIGFELNADYAAMGRARIRNRGGVAGIKASNGQRSLFPEAADA